MKITARGASFLLGTLALGTAALAYTDICGRTVANYSLCSTVEECKSWCLSCATASRV
ncbi:MAG: hypothetical protein IT437_09215 [Phycisphaerales bacterium]|nr:hypothetical protein [Phycisphaerales bacterium]